MVKRCLMYGLILVVLFILPACNQNLVGKATDPINQPQNFFCSFALQDSKHQKLCVEDNPTIEGVTQLEVDVNALPRNPDLHFYLVSQDASTHDIERDQIAKVQSDAGNKLRVIIPKPIASNKKHVVLKWGYYSTNHKVNGERTWRQIDLEQAFLAAGVQKLNAFDSLLDENNPNNPNSLWFDLNTAQTNVEYEISIGKDKIDGNEIAVDPDETHVALFMCTCDDCSNQDKWECNPRNLNSEELPNTFDTNDFRYGLEKVTITNICNLCYEGDIGVSVCRNLDDCKERTYDCSTFATVEEQLCEFGCSNGNCLTKAPECNNGIKDGDETEVDCGGSCQPCHFGAACIHPNDCQSNECNNGACQPLNDLSATIHSIDIVGENVEIRYSKNYGTCAHLLKRPFTRVHNSNFFCTEGIQIKIVQPLSKFSFQVGDELRLCHGNNYNACSESVIVEG